MQKLDLEENELVSLLQDFALEFSGNQLVAHDIDNGLAEISFANS